MHHSQNTIENFIEDYIMSVTCKVGFRRYEFQSELDLNRARVLYDDAMDDATDTDEDDYQVQERFEEYLERDGIDFFYDL